MTVTCSFCPRKFDTLQQLGGHQTRHREEMKAFRKEHEEKMKKRRHEHPMQMECEKNHNKITMEVLAPNPKFWKPYRKYGIEPKVIEFMPVANKHSELVKTTNYCETSLEIIDLTFRL